MPTKRQVLDLLTRDELLALADGQRIIVGDRRVKAHIVDRLEEKAPAVPELLTGYPRDRLKELCRTLGLDDGGREKAPLLARLGDAPVAAPTGATATQLALPMTAAPATPSAQPRPARARPIPTPVPPSPRSFTSFREITDFLWTNAERLRGAYKPNEYDKVILPFLVIRRLECVLDPTKARVLDEVDRLKARGLKLSDPIADAMLRKITQVPFYNTSKLDLAKLAGAPNQIAQDLRHYLRAFSPNARDVVEQFKLDDHITRLDEANLLYQIVGLFAGVKLHPDEVKNHVMGSIFEELIRRFNEKKNEEAGDHYTPREIIRLMVDLLFVEDDDALRKPRVTRTLFDPACGTGGMLSVAEEYLRALNDKAELVAFGQELNPETYAVCKSDMMIKGQGPENIVRGNSFNQDGHKDRKFDYLLSNPPFGIDWKNVQKDVEDEHEEQGFAGRFGAGLPRISDGALLFLLHMISKMKPVDPKTGAGGSRLAIVLNGSPLFSGDAGSGESEIRRWILENDMLEAIVALPEQMFFNTGISTYVWVLTNRKPERRKGKVQLVNAVDLYRKMDKSLGNKRRALTQEHIDVIVTAFDSFAESEISKIFDNEDFGYRRITIERPLRISFQASAERIERLREETGFQNLGKNQTKRNGAAGQEQQEAILRALGKLDPGKTYKSRKLFEEELEALMRAAGVDMPAPVRKAILAALGERDESAEVCLDHKGAAESDAELRDYENVPLKEDVVAYFEREVRPHVPDAWIAGVEAKDGRVVVVENDKLRIGYEIPMTRHFYKRGSLRSLEQIDRDIRNLQDNIQVILSEILL